MLGMTSFAAAFRFADDVRLWSREVEVNPACREGKFYLAEAHRERGDLEAAGAAFERAIADVHGQLSYVDRKAALQNLGVVRLALGQTADAEHAFFAARSLIISAEERRRLDFNLAVVALRQGRFAEVLLLLHDEATRSDPMPMARELYDDATHRLAARP